MISTSQLAPSESKNDCLLLHLGLLHSSIHVHFSQMTAARDKAGLPCFLSSWFLHSNILRYKKSMEMLDEPFFGGSKRGEMEQQMKEMLSKVKDYYSEAGRPR